MIGYAVVGDDGDADSVSDPDLRGDGADDQLLAWLEAQNRPVEQRRVRALYEKAGMHVVEEFHRWEWTP